MSNRKNKKRTKKEAHEKDSTEKRLEVIENLIRTKLFKNPVGRSPGRSSGGGRPPPKIFGRIDFPHTSPEVKKPNSHPKPERMPKAVYREERMPQTERVIIRKEPDAEHLLKALEKNPESYGQLSNKLLEKMEKDFQRLLEVTIKDVEIAARKEYEAMELEATSNKKTEARPKDVAENRESIEAKSEQSENIKATEVEKTEITESESDGIGKSEAKLEVVENQDMEVLEANALENANDKEKLEENSYNPHEITGYMFRDPMEGGPFRGEVGNDEQEKRPEIESEINAEEVDAEKVETEDLQKDQYLEDEAEALREREADQDLVETEPSTDVIEQLENQDLSKLEAEIFGPEIEADETEPSIEAIEPIMEQDIEADKQDEEGMT